MGEPTRIADTSVLTQKLFLLSDICGTMRLLDSITVS